MFGSKKGLFSLEYLAVLVIFMSFATYFAFKLLEERPEYINEVKNELYRSENYRISEILVNDPGHPLNWDTLELGQVNRIGLLDDSENKTNLLSESKVTKLGEICQGNGYYTVKSLLGTSREVFIMINSADDSFQAVTCGQVVEEEVQSSIMRLVAFDSGSFGNLTVKVW